MKIFKNKVGRPSNEMKMLKRTFYMSLIAIIASFIAIILSCVVNVKDSTTKTQGALLSDYQINLKSTNGKKANGSGWTNLWEYDTASSYTIEFEVINRKSDKVYYRYFAYDDDTNKLDYNSKTNGEFYYDKTICSTAVEKGYSKRKTVQKTINLSNKNKKIRSVLKLYTSKDDCKKDDNGKGKSVFSKEIVSKVKSSDNNSNNNDSDTKKAVSFLEWLINFFKSLFSKKDDKPSNSGNNEATPPTTPPTTPPPKTTKPATFTPPVSTNLKMTVPSNGDIKHDIAVGCNTTVYAPFSGTATYTTKYYNGKTAGYGNVVEIKSSDGVYKVKLAHLNSFEGYTVLYGNAETGISCVSVSCQTKTYDSKAVKQGDIIGKTGSSGNSTGCHLHIELYKNGSKVDPSTYFGY